MISLLFIIFYSKQINDMNIVKYGYTNTSFISPKLGLDSIVPVSNDSISRDSTDYEDYLIFVYDDMPSTKKDLCKFIKKQMNYPPKALRDSLEGRVDVECIVDTLGFTINHKIIRGVRQDIDDEALRIARLIKFDKPALQRGKPVEVKYCLPIIFELPTKKKDRRRKHLSTFSLKKHYIRHNQV